MATSYYYHHNKNTEAKPAFDTCVVLQSLVADGIFSSVKSLLVNLCFLWVRSHILLLFRRQALVAAQICIPHLVIINVLAGKGGGKRTLFQSMFLPNSFWLNLQTKAELY